MYAAPVHPSRLTAASSPRFSRPCRQSQVSNTKGRASGEEEGSQGPRKEEDPIQQAVRLIALYLSTVGSLLPQIRQRYYPAAGWEATNVSVVFHTLAPFRALFSVRLNDESKKSCIVHTERIVLTHIHHVFRSYLTLRTFPVFRLVNLVLTDLWLCRNPNPGS